MTIRRRSRDRPSFASRKAVLRPKPPNFLQRPCHSLVGLSATIEAAFDEPKWSLRVCDYLCLPETEANRPTPRDKSASACDCRPPGEPGVCLSGPCGAQFWYACSGSARRLVDRQVPPGPNT